jgi:hypothetical protein
VNKGDARSSYCLALQGEGQAEFETYFEKVVDARLVFVPTAAEAIAIALQKNDTISKLLRQNCETLSISNIRVIKKIERLARCIVTFGGRTRTRTLDPLIKSQRLSWNGRRWRPAILSMERSLKFATDRGNPATVCG